MPLRARGVDSARWQEGGWEETCLAFPASQRLRPTRGRPQGLPDYPLGGKELQGCKDSPPHLQFGKVPFLLWDRLKQTVGSAPIPETKIHN